MNSNPDFLPSLLSNATLIVVASLGFYHLVSGKRRRPTYLMWALILLAGYVMVFTPADATVATDRGNYQGSFLSGLSDRINDLGFLWYINAVKVFIGKDFLLYLTINVVLYLGGYLYFTRTVTPRNWEYVIMMWFLNIGFLNYFTNTMREGMALSMMLCGLAFLLRNRKYLAVTIFVVAVLFHFSMALVVLGLLMSLNNVKIRYFYFMWLSMLTLSYLNQSSFLTNLVRLTDYEKAINYAQALSEAGFRYDFILYSLYPLLMGFYYISVIGYSNPLYLRLYKIYISTNAIWLLFVRIPFTDRIAFLSWCLIPFVVMMPLVDDSRSNPIRNRYRLAGALLLFACIVKLIL